LAANSGAIDQPRDVPGWPRNVAHKSAGNRIEIDGNHDDWNSLARGQCGFQRNLQAQSHDYIDLCADQFSCVCKGFGLSLVDPSVFDDQILALGESELGSGCARDDVFS
jgi:hypothetical protein